ncbi:hypothetical protein [Thaumasiovibrio sp. DFM-14]|uniref:hypothetical protein n=1 Tax=Thaumasiovibrio sp. DFM-14 TaxID=3384792 RepID=UPI0039A35023
MLFQHLHQINHWNDAPFGIMTTTSRIHSSRLGRENCEFLPQAHLKWLLHHKYARFETSSAARHLVGDLDEKLVLTDKWYKFINCLTVDFDFRSTIR